MTQYDYDPASDPQTLQEFPPVEAVEAGTTDETDVPSAPPASIVPPTPVAPAGAGNGRVTISLNLTITVDGNAGGVQINGAPISAPVAAHPSALESLTVDTEEKSRRGAGGGRGRQQGQQGGRGQSQQGGRPTHVSADYSDREGFDPRFPGFDAPLPTLTATAAKDAFVGDDNQPRELRYHHYSILFNQRRRLAFVSAVNYDPTAPIPNVERKGRDPWQLDGRMPAEVQIGDGLYKNNDIDKGHLSRRADAAWGKTDDEAMNANLDTFHYTNCSPQHQVFNQSRLSDQQGVLLWGNLENHVTEQAHTENKRVSVYNGPLFRRDDAVYRNVPIPREFYKIIAFQHTDGTPGVLAFVLSQAELIRDLPLEDFVTGPFQPFQVSLADIEKKTGLDFGPLLPFDPLTPSTAKPRATESLEVSTVPVAPVPAAIPLNGPGDIVFRRAA